MKLPISVLLSLLLTVEGMAAASDPVPWQDADGYVGEVCTVEGKVLTARREGNVLRLVFDADPATFTVALIASWLSPLPADAATVYEGRVVRASGKIRSFRGVSEMMIRDSSQIIILPVEAEAVPTAGVSLQQRVEQLEERVERLERRIKK